MLIRSFFGGKGGEEDSGESTWKDSKWTGTKAVDISWKWQQMTRTWHEHESKCLSLRSNKLFGICVKGSIRVLFASPGQNDVKGRPSKEADWRRRRIRRRRRRGRRGRRRGRGIGERASYSQAAVPTSNIQNTPRFGWRIGLNNMIERPLVR